MIRSNDYVPVAKGKLVRLLNGHTMRVATPARGSRHSGCAVRAADAQMALLAKWAAGHIGAITRGIEAELSWGR